MNKNKKNVIWNMIGSTIISFNSFFFLIIVTRINGISDAGIFTYSYATACLLYAIAVYAGRAFQVTENNKKISDTDYIYNRITTCLIMMLVLFGFLIFKQYDPYKSMILLLLCLYRCFEAFIESIFAVIQKNGDLYKVGKSLFIKALLIIVTFIIVDIITKNLILSCISILVMNTIVFVLYDLKNLKKLKMIKTKYNFKNNLYLIKSGMYTFIFSFLSLYVLNASRYAIDSILNSNDQAIYGIIVMPAMIMSLLTQFIIHPYLITLSKKFNNNERKEFTKLCKKIIYTMIVLGIIGILFASVLGIPFLEIIYNISLSEYFIPFMLIMFGALFYGLCILISSFLITMRKTFCQFIILLIVSITAVISSYLLVKNYQIIGASVGYLLVMFLEFTLYLIVFYKQVSKSDK